jgi:hypothetical protein
MLYDKKWDTQIDIDLPSQILIKAAEVLEQRGWCQDQVVNHATGSVCLAGAVLLAAGFEEHELNDSCVTPPAVEEAFCRLDVITDPFSPSDWNDVRGRTIADVLSACWKAAEIRRFGP